MNTSEFRSLAMKSAEMYYKYLDEHKKGYLRTPVISCRQHKYNHDYYVLKASRILYIDDSTMLEVNDTIFHAKEFEIVSLDQDNGEIVIFPTKLLARLIDKTDAHRISIVSDMKFLVKRVCDWYQLYGKRIKSTQNKPLIACPPVEDFVSPPSDEQLLALDVICRNTYSYVWGAPGTGKTRFVLAHAIEAYLKKGASSDANRKVIITAPTNNAVDQTLLGVLDAFENTGVGLSRIKRLGNPTEQLFRKYPQVCEHGDASEKIAKLKQTLNKIEQCLKYYETEKRLSVAVRAYEPVSDRIISVKKERERLEKKIDSVSAENELRIDEYCAANKAFDAAKTARDKHINWMNSFKMKVGFFFSPERQRDAIDRLERLEQEAGNAEARALKAFDISQNCRAQIEDLKKQLIGTPSVQGLLAETQNIPVDPNSIEALINRTFCSYFESAGAQASYQAFVDECVSLLPEPPVDEYKALSEADLLERRDRALSDLESFERDTAKFESSIVIAVTLDKLISSYDLFFTNKNESIVDHVFVDEAAYCPVIKSAVAYSLDCPVTMLGDHMQLPPVCEMNDAKNSDYDEKLAVLWKRHGVFAEQIFYESLEEIYDCYHQKFEYAFRKTKMIPLNRTYRFGEKLADVLARYVYSENFSGNPDVGTSITVLDVPRISVNNDNRQMNNERRSNRHEADAIRRYVSQNIMKLYANGFCVLAPYKNQIVLLKKALRPLLGVDVDAIVQTIHAAQGKEYGTVIVSVTDTYDMYFTNSRNQQSRGLQIINTAISRAKNELVLVCDAGWWRTKEAQLLCEVITCADEVIPYTPNH